jgi:hypothetical protein
MATVDLLINGVSYWADTVYESCHFESQVNGVAGPCSFRVRDPDRTKTFVPGQTILLTVDGSAVWRGFVSIVNRVFSFPALNVADFGLARFIDIVGIDINILLLKRIVSNQTTPTNVEGPLVAAHTPDSTAIATLFAGWLDLSGDGLDTTTLVENVADTTWTESGTLWEGSDTWSQAMQSIANLPAAIYYIDPDKNFVYTDVDTPSAPFNLSDQPNGTTTRGYREMEVLKDGTGLANDVMAWGMGYGSQTPVFVRDTDATSQAAHGLWQQSQISFGVYKQATIDRIAQSIIDGSPQNKRGAKNDRVAVQCVTYIPGLRPAQKVDFTSNAFGFNDVIPIRKMEIDFPAADTPKYTLTLSHEIDTPFGFFDPFLLHLPNPKCPPPLVMGPNGKCIMPPIIQGGGCDCGITDSFTRTVSDGWGTSDYGVVWGGVVNASQFSVDGTHGVLTMPAVYGTNFIDLYPLPGVGNDLYVRGVTMTNMVNITSNFDPSFYVFIEGYQLFIFRDDGRWGHSGSLMWVQEFYLSGSDTPVLFPAGVDISQPFDIHIQATGTSYTANAWQSNTAEPVGWQYVGTNFYSPFVMDFLEIGGHSGTGTGTRVLSIDGIDITGVTRCSAVQFDDFNRTVASGWGTATPSGYAWTMYGSGGTAGVNGATAYLTSTTGDSRTFQADGAGPWSEPAWTLTTRFAMTHDVSANYGQLDMYASAPGPYGTEYINFSLAIINGGGSVQIGPDTAGVGQYTKVAKNDWSDTSWYLVKMEVSATSQKIKVWKEVDPEPGTWLAEVVRSPSTPSDIHGITDMSLFDTFFVYETLDNAGSVYIDSIDFDYAGRPCYPGGPPAGSGISSNAWACESFNPATTTLTLVHPFLVNSPRVWLNGLLQPQSSYTQNGIARTITFDFTPLATDNARVCYWATA